MAKARVYLAGLDNILQDTRRVACRTGGMPPADGDRQVERPDILGQLGRDVMLSVKDCRN